MDGILFNKEFVDKYPEVVTAFIDGALQGADLYETDMTSIKKVMPMFSTSSDEDIISNCQSAKLMTYADNMNVLNGTAKSIYTSMCDVWSSVGENVNKDIVDDIFDDTLISTLASKYDQNDVTETDANVTITEENKQEAIDAEALLQNLRQLISLLVLLNSQMQQRQLRHSMNLLILQRY